MEVNRINLFFVIIFLIKNYLMSLQVGQKAPEFTLFNSEKKEISLSGFIGNPVLLLFFPQAFTGVCTTELCTIRDNMAQYNAVNVNVLGISVDSVFTLAKFKEEQSYNFDLLSDFNKEVSEAYAAIYESFAFGMKGVSKRSAFLIDAEGMIAYAEVLESAGDQPDFKAIQSAIEAL